MLVHCLRRWPNIKPVIVNMIVFAGLWYEEDTQVEEVHI